MCKISEFVPRKKKVALFSRTTLLFLINADLFFVSAHALEFNHAVFESEERIVSADADVVAGVDLRAALANDDTARKHRLPVLTLYAEAFRVRVSAVVRGTGTLFMSE